jgi:hypothetical protein
MVSFQALPFSANFSVSPDSFMGPSKLPTPPSQELGEFLDNLGLDSFNYLIGIWIFSEHLTLFQIHLLQLLWQQTTKGRWYLC